MKVLRPVQVLGELLITAGVLLLLFVGWQLLWTDVAATREQGATVQTLERQFGHPRKGVKMAGLTEVPSGQAFAIVLIPRFGKSYARPVLEGTTYPVLQKGFGHYARTALPGHVGNFAVAGHRTTNGKPLNQIATLRKGDVVVVETRASYFVYAVTGHVIVRPTQTEVIAPVPQHPGRKPTTAYLTMTSCHPEYSARQRYIVFATLQRTFARADGLPASYLAAPTDGG